MLNVWTSTLHVMYVKSIITWDRYKRNCVRRQDHSKIMVKCFGSDRLFIESWNFIFFTFSVWFGHLPKYYPTIFAVSYFTKVFFLQNFVSYGNAIALCYNFHNPLIAYSNNNGVWHFIVQCVLVVMSCSQQFVDSTCLVVPMGRRIFV